MKQTYIKPEMEIVEMDTEALMLTMSTPEGNNGLGGTSWGGGTDEEFEADANRRRGTWGNLWESNSRW